ncbi:hypothetical protein HOK68_01930 [Candidatus Woesearchaeota archaeon]|jgi:hypothetical protein|nr:hypothetical protein [Candidatus Woesearchaeota archaeon]MBT4387601.1 hypothetical protein [Candidatus Woesearchaeota archaeon]MBT4596037.1 hypothetical protein [Candidatus Woesearchaeota archaeon]MBT5740745.1 hypothetical protein [Candidatus Woesearchaeota archaeon]MBT6505519.1 hypothetical protein [Candidatus Woesearchaeota archaeon]
MNSEGKLEKNSLVEKISNILFIPLAGLVVYNGIVMNLNNGFTNKKIDPLSVPDTIELKLKIDFKEFKFGVPKELYLRKKNQLRKRDSETKLSDYVTSPELNKIFALIDTYENGNTFPQKVKNFMSNNFTYQNDTTPFFEKLGIYRGYTKYPIETLIENGGDCEDHTVFLASALDYKKDRKFLFVYEPQHVTLGIEKKSGEHKKQLITLTDDMLKLRDQISKKLAEEKGVEPGKITVGEINNALENYKQADKDITKQVYFNHQGVDYELFESTKKGLNIGNIERSDFNITNIVQYEPVKKNQFTKN